MDLYLPFVFDVSFEFVGFCFPSSNVVVPLSAHNALNPDVPAAAAERRAELAEMLQHV